MSEGLYLSGHHFEETADKAAIICLGCNKTYDELTVEASGRKDGISVCKKPHSEAEKGQLLRVG